jgi:hypothetical protein
MLSSSGGSLTACPRFDFGGTLRGGRIDGAFGGGIFEGRPPLDDGGGFIEARFAGGFDGRFGAGGAFGADAAFGGGGRDPPADDRGT